MEPELFAILAHQQLIMAHLTCGKRFLEHYKIFLVLWNYYIYTIQYFALCSFYNSSRLDIFGSTAASYPKM